MDRTIRASDFKARCLALLDQVARSGESLVITKHGKPVARVVPLEQREHKPLIGSVTLLADDDNAYFSAGDASEWNAERGVLLREDEPPRA